MLIETRPPHVALICITTTLAASAATAQPTVMEQGWILNRSIFFNAPQGAHFNPVDGNIYVARRNGMLPNATDGLYVINADESASLIAAAD